ncbi:type II secretion system protein [Terriglobus sp.]|uniref:type II secretion system protein n=1 Tax=Terriglobus sp. TaxID=1889013 RepID=UPI003B0043E6
MMRGLLPAQGELVLSVVEIRRPATEEPDACSGLATSPGQPQAAAGRPSEQGFLLIALVVAVFIIALLLTVAAPTVARSLERDKELESEHRAQQYVRAIHNYYLKFNTYPTSIDQLLNQNNMHFLRQQYKDPLTRGDYRLIHFGEAKTQVKGFFGEPLGSVGQGSLGASAGTASGFGSGVSGAGSTPGSGAAASPVSGSGFSLGTSSFSSPGSSGGIGSTAGASTTGVTGGSSGSGSSPSGISSNQVQGSKGAIVGVGSSASGHGLVEWNGSANIEDWEFLYDHRTWLLKQQVSIFGGSVGQGGGSTFGTPGIGSANGSSTAPIGSTPFAPSSSASPSSSPGSTGSSASGGAQPAQNP